MPISRRLTSGEIALAREVFSEAVDYSSIRVRDWPCAPWQPRESGMTPRGRMYMRGCYLDDYSKADTYTRSFFIHEMAHAWQFQNKVLHPVVSCAELYLKHKFNYASAYFFTLDGKKDLTDYGSEQQAAIVQEYYLHRQGNQFSTGHCMNACDNREKARLLEKTLEKFLKDPGYARQKKFFHPFQRLSR